mmetsp:Transcript_25591/g.63477  ORF Transcript_25591/g.63477 Transcript_25591/m.63477 type:complete len:229 (-) Transcript_25591:1022-1708(-)
MSHTADWLFRDDSSMSRRIYTTPSVTKRSSFRLWPTTTFLTHSRTLSRNSSSVRLSCPPFDRPRSINDLSIAEMICSPPKCLKWFFMAVLSEHTHDTTKSAIVEQRISLSSNSPVHVASVVVNVSRISESLLVRSSGRALPTAERNVSTLSMSVCPLASCFSASPTSDFMDACNSQLEESRPLRHAHAAPGAVPLAMRDDRASVRCCRVDGKWAHAPEHSMTISHIKS